MNRTASAVWRGSLKEGKGTISTASGVLSDTQYSFSTRFENGKGTNPEELIAAAHAGCFSMALTLGLETAGLKPQSVKSSSVVHLDHDASGFTITSIDLTSEASVAGIDAAKFQEIAETTKKGCPVSRALAGTKITLNAKLA